MAQDLATLALGLTNEPAIAGAKATGAALEEMGVKGEAAARKIAASSNPVTEAIKKQAVTVEQSRRAWAASGGDMGRFAQELQRVANAQDRATASLARVEPVANTGRLSLGRLGNQFTNLIGQVAGTPPVLGNVLSVLGNFAIGAGIMTGVLGGLALLAAAYTLITKGAREAKDKADDLTQSLVEQSKAAFQATQFGAKTVVWAAERNLENIKNEPRVGVLGLPLRGADAAARAQREADAQTAIDQANANLGKITLDAIDKETEARKKASDERKRLLEEAARAEAQFQANVTRARDASIAIDLWQARERIKAEEEVKDARLKLEKEAQDVRTAANKKAEQDYLTHATKQAEEHKQIAENLVRSMQETWSTFFEDIFTKGMNSFRDLFSGIKQLFLKLIADMLAAGVMRRMAGIFGGMGAGTAGGGSGSGGMLSGLGAQMAGQAAMGGIAGGFVGYGVGGMVGSAAGGAVAGGLSGAAAGFMVGGPLGALAGGLTGLVGGLLGGANAAREAAQAMRQLKKDYDAALASFSGDELGAALARNAAMAEQLRKMFDDAWTFWDTLRNPTGRQEEMDRIAREEQRNAEIIRRQATYAQEDLVVRNLRATGQGGAADQLAFQNQQAREMQAAIDANRDATYLSYLATVHNNELIAYQNGLLSTALRNSPSGFFVERYLGGFAGRGAPTPPPGYPTDGGATPPGGGGGGRPTHGKPITIILQVDGKVLTRTVVNGLDQTAAATGGAGSSRSEALERY